MLTTRLLSFMLIILHVAAIQAADNRKHVAIMLFDGVELLDFAGPAEVFIVASQRKPFRVFTVAPARDPIKTMGGITINPDFAFGDAPHADILVVPGGNTRAAGAEGVRWIRESAQKADIIMSVCYGAFLLADAGLLDGISATTHRWGIDSLKSAAPKCKVVVGQRYVDSGKIITTAGVTAGIDGALHVVERIYGKDLARWTSEYWMEYKRMSPAMTTPE